MLTRSLSVASTSNTYTTTTASAAVAAMHHPPANYGSDPTSPNTTFVQADPSTFRTIVQKLTGASDDPSTQKLPLTLPTRPAPKPVPVSDMGPKRPAFKLHERRLSTKKLEIKLNPTNATATTTATSTASTNYGYGADYYDNVFVRQRGFLVSPVSPLEFFSRGSPRSPAAACEEVLARGSPMTACGGEEEEEERAIAEKGFYLHPSPLSTPRVAEPELLTLFPLHSPRDNADNNNSSSCS